MEKLGNTIQKFFDDGETLPIIPEEKEKEIAGIKIMVEYVCRENGTLGMGKIYLKSLIAYGQNPEYFDIIMTEFKKYT